MTARHSYYESGPYIAESETGASLWEIQLETARSLEPSEISSGVGSRLEAAGTDTSAAMGKTVMVGSTVLEGALGSVDFLGSLVSERNS